MSLLALSTLSSFHCFLPPSSFLLDITLVKHYRLTIDFFDVSTVSAKNSSSFNILSTSAIIFIAYQNHHHLTKNMTYMGNVNASNITSAIIFSMNSFLFMVKNWVCAVQTQKNTLLSLWGKSLGDHSLS